MASRNDHIRAEELFSAYIDKRVTADEQTFVERHVASCADCRTKLQATRAMIVALKAMPPVRAPRSFVLPKELAKQPKRSVFAWYPALRFATVMAVVAFAFVFASDLLTIRGGSVSSVTLSAPAPTALQAPAAAPMAQEAQAQAAPATSAPAAPAPAQPAMKAAEPTQVPTAIADQSLATAAPVAGMMRVQATDTPTATNPMALMAQPATSETLTMTAASDLVQPTEMAEATPAPDRDRYDQATPESAAPSATHEVVQALDPLRIATIALGGLVVVLLAATLIARRNA